MIFKTVIPTLFIVLLFLGGLVTAWPLTIYDNPSELGLHNRGAEHQNSSFEILDSLFGYADSLKLWRFCPNC